MKFATLRVGAETRLAIVEDGRAVHLLDEDARDIVSLIERPELASTGSSKPVPAHARLAAPIPRPRRNIFCVGKNYHDHAKEFSLSGFDSGASSQIPETPIIFSKVPDCVIADGDAITFDPSVSEAIDYEGELAVIVGKGGRGIGKAQAMDHVWGYTIINDITARDVQGRMKQWHVSKSFDTFCPMGPWAVTADELDLADTHLRTWVNGELRQDTNTRDLIFDVPTIIEVLSAGMTLYPGDVIATGTPAGVGIGFKPAKYLRDQDVVVIEVEGLGRLENPVRAGTSPGFASCS